MSMCNVDKNTRKRTLLDNFTDEHFGKTSYNLGDGLRDLLSECLLNDLFLSLERSVWFGSSGSYLSNGLFWQGVSTVCFKPIVLSRTKVVHEDSEGKTSRLSVRRSV